MNRDRLDQLGHKESKESRESKVHRKDIDTIQRLSEPVVITPGATDHGTATCNPDEKVTGGGFTTSDNLNVITSLREGDHNEWVSGATNPTSQDGTIRAVVECAKLIDVP